MILLIDHWLFGDGGGLKSPYYDDVFYWLSGELYTFFHGLGAQLQSIQWTHPKPGETRILAGRKFVVYQSRRRWFRVMVSWSLVRLPEDAIEAHEEIRSLHSSLQNGG